MIPNDRFLLPTGDTKRSFVSRAGHKLEAAIVTFGIDVAGKLAADLGCNVGGFTDCLLQHGAAKVYAVDTAYGVLAWTLRKDPRVVVKERVNAMHVCLPEPVDVVAIDVGWTRQEKILPVAATLLNPGGLMLSLIKPHYESELAKKKHGVLTEPEAIEELDRVIEKIKGLGLQVRGVVKSPIEGQKGNVEFVAWLEC
jgi:23S rRNA (cytidine1920-2'-O)/16S rRNA (cytidine1409-2'-O)-methyltransferase